MFGFEAWTLSCDTKKLDEKSIKCIFFIGYGDALMYGKFIRGYRLRSPDGRGIIRRHVRFVDSFLAKNGFLNGNITIELVEFDSVVQEIFKMLKN